MADFTKDEFVHELLLILYYSDYKEYFLNDDTIDKINEFIGMCRAKDLFDNSQITYVVETYYDSNNGVSKKERRSQVGLSDAALYRFGVKIADSLMDFLSVEKSKKIFFSRNYIRALLLCREFYSARSMPKNKNGIVYRL